MLPIHLLYIHNGLKLYQKIKKTPRLRFFGEIILEGVYCKGQLSKKSKKSGQPIFLALLRHFSIFYIKELVILHKKNQNWSKVEHNGILSYSGDVDFGSIWIFWKFDPLPPFLGPQRGHYRLFLLNFGGF